MATMTYDYVNILDVAFSVLGKIVIFGTRSGAVELSPT